MCVVTTIKYTLNALASPQKVEFVANDLLWTVRTWLLISSYSLHLVFWGQLYEESEELVLLSQSHITTKWKIILYIYIAIIGADTIMVILVDSL